MAVEVKIMGRPAASIGGRSISIPAKGYALIALLSSTRNFTAQVQEIRSMLWPQSTERASAAALRQLSVRIRRQTAGVDIVPSAGSMRSLALSEISLDVVSLRQNLKLVGVTKHIENRAEEKANLLLETYREELLEGIEFGWGLEEELVEWVSIERAWYKKQVLNALRRILATATLPMLLADAIAERLLDDDPADQAAWTQKLKDALANRGNNTPELTYARCLKAYRGERGRFPPPQLEELRDKLARSRLSGRPDIASASSCGDSATKRKGERPLLLLTRALNGFGLDTVDASLYEKIVFSLSNYRALDIVECGTGNWPSHSSAAEAYAFHVAPRTTTQLGFWLSMVNPRQRSESSSRLSGQLLWTGSIEKEGGSSSAFDRQLTLITRAIVGEIERAERDKFGSDDAPANKFRQFLKYQRQSLAW
ncbi:MULTISPECIES: hypothetical protein [Mesorhizobium]|uniref:Bacterial transcriptional activator domain-containing protein n=1 Tax=Mesorhizobium caraganae TaxID=483206 RepID=A0ABV1Z860_9HYPH